MHWETLQEGIFLWVYKLKQPYEGVMNMPYFKARKYMEMYMKVQQEITDGIKKAGDKMKSGSVSKLK
jgi:hypothetical protein